MAGREPRPAIPSLSLEPLPIEELADLDADDRAAEVWLLNFSGYNQVQIGERFGISRQMVSKILKTERAGRISRREQIDDDVEDAIGACEAVMDFSLRRAMNTGPDSMAGPAHMKNVLEALDRKIKLRGLDKSDANAGGKIGTTNFTVNIGTTTGGAPTIEVVQDDDGIIDAVVVG